MAILIKIDTLINIVKTNDETHEKLVVTKLAHSKKVEETNEQIY